MKTISSEEEIESDRLEDLKEVSDTWEERFKERFEFDSFGHHEASDRSYIVAENFESYVLKHPTVVMYPELYRDAHKISEILYEFYNAVSCSEKPVLQTGKEIE